MKYEIVIFDFDGTLADTKEDVWESVEHAANSIGCRIPHEFRGNSQNLSLPIDRIFQSLLPKPEGLLKDVFECELTRHYRQLNSFTHSYLFPGIQGILEELKRRDIPRYIVSMKPLQALNKIIIEKGWGDYFVEWYSVDPDVYEWRTKEQVLGALKDRVQPKNCVYVGDSYTDIIAARACGMDSVGILYGDGDAERLIQEKPTYLVASKRELEKILLEG